MNKTMAAVAAFAAIAFRSPHKVVPPPMAFCDMDVSRTALDTIRVLGSHHAGGAQRLATQRRRRASRVSPCYLAHWLSFMSQNAIKK